MSNRRPLGNKLVRGAWLARWSLVLASGMVVASLVALSLPALSGGGSKAGASRLPPPPVATVSASPAQTMDGFGASGAWWPNDLAAFPPAVQEHVASLLFDRSGIALSGYRYNIGGGSVGVLVPEHAAPTFLVAPGVYNWSADPAGLRFLQLAAEHRVPLLTGFVNSAPTAWTSDHRSCGGSLVPGSETAYANYLADVVRHLHDSLGITLSFVSPMNEPDASFFLCTQEGMSVPVAQRGAVVRSLGQALADKAPWARVIADESSKVFWQFLPEVSTWMSQPGTAPWVAALAHHTYDYPSDVMATLASSVGRRFAKPTWATEICCFDGKRFGPSYDPTMDSGMWLANTIWQDLALTGDSAFYWWSALSPRMGCDPSAQVACATTANDEGWNDGLLYYDPYFRINRDYGIYTTKRFWVLGNFSRFVRPGAVLHPVGGAPPEVHLLAFSSARHWVVVAIDDGPAGTPSDEVKVVLPQAGPPLQASRAFVTSATSDLAPAALPRPDTGNSFVVHVDPQSVTTFVFGDGSTTGRTASLRRGGRGATDRAGRTARSL
jgi:O-glycosyl hydrolase